MSDKDKLRPEQGTEAEAAILAARRLAAEAEDEADILHPLKKMHPEPEGEHIPPLTEHHQMVPSPEAQQIFHDYKPNDLILITVVNWVVYVLLIFAFFLFWTGHNAPGGGFIAGLMTAAVVVLLYVSVGSGFIRQTLRFDFKYLVAIGLTFALGCGLGGVLFGDPFLTHTFGHFELPFFGDLELATATIFDLGVYLVVTGGCVTIITSIGESQREQAADSEAETV